MWEVCLHFTLTVVEESFVYCTQAWWFKKETVKRWSYDFQYIPTLQMWLAEHRFQLALSLKTAGICTEKKLEINYSISMALVQILFFLCYFQEKWLSTVLSGKRPPKTWWLSLLWIIYQNNYMDTQTISWTHGQLCGNTNNLVVTWTITWTHE